MPLVNCRYEGYVHAYEGSKLVYCSEAEEWDHYGEPGTGYGWCPHDTDAAGVPVVVRTFL